MKTMTKAAVLTIITALAALCGCRREDIRECTFVVPGMTEDNVPRISKALSAFNRGSNPGIKTNIFDVAGKKLTVRYDSMQLAQTNIRMAISELGIDVTFPEKKPGEAAGYIDTH